MMLIHRISECERKLKNTTSWKVTTGWSVAMNDVTSLWHHDDILKPSRSGPVVYSTVLDVRGLDGHGFEPRTSTNACGHICRYVDWKGLATMLTSIQSAGVTPEVNLRNSLHAGNKAHKQGIHPGFETQGSITKVQNRGISSLTKRTYVLQKFL